MRNVHVQCSDLTWMKYSSGICQTKLPYIWMNEWLMCVMSIVNGIELLVCLSLSYARWVVNKIRICGIWACHCWSSEFNAAALCRQKHHTRSATYASSLCHRMDNLCVRWEHGYGWFIEQTWTRVDHSTVEAQTWYMYARSANVDVTYMGLSACAACCRHTHHTHETLKIHRSNKLERII